MAISIRVYILVKNVVRSQLSIVDADQELISLEYLLRYISIFFFSFLTGGLTLEYPQSLVLIKAKVLVPHNWSTQHRENT